MNHSISCRSLRCFIVVLVEISLMISTSFGSGTKHCGRLMCLQKATKCSPATLPVSQLLPLQQLAASSKQRQETMEVIKVLGMFKLSNHGHMVGQSSWVRSFDVRPSNWRIDMTWCSVSSLFALKKDITDLYRSTYWSLLCLYGLYAVMNYSQQATLTSLKRSEVSFGEALKRAPTAHAYPLSPISVASAGICKPHW